jgi:hypothetical protein
MQTVFLDTQILIYALEHNRADAQELVEQVIGKTGRRLVASEETLYEFSQSGSAEAAANLTRALLDLNPVWLRSFADIQADEAINFVNCAPLQPDIPRPQAILETFAEASELAGKHFIDPIGFVAIARDGRAQQSLADNHALHAKVLDELTALTQRGELTSEKALIAFTNKVNRLLTRGSERSPAVRRSQLAAALAFCRKHRRRFMRECHSFSVEHHLSDFRTANPNRSARLSDSTDLTLSSAAFPYVDLFITDDGYLHNGLTFVKKKLPFITTELFRPFRNAA